MTVVDVGANNGFFSLLAAHLVGRNGHVFAFEPSRSAYARLRRNLDLNGASTVEARHLAIGDRSQMVTLYVMDHNDAASSRVPLGKGFDPEQVNGSTLDRELADATVDVVKIDVEGYEPEVLTGMRHLLQRNPGLRIICEYDASLVRIRRDSPNRLFELLSSFGLSAREIYKDGGLGLPIRSSDALTHGNCNLLCGAPGQ